MSRDQFFDTIKRLGRTLSKYGKVNPQALSKEGREMAVGQFGEDVIVELETVDEGLFTSLFFVLGGLEFLPRALKEKHDEEWADWIHAVRCVVWANLGQFVALAKEEMSEEDRP